MHGSDQTLAAMALCLRALRCLLLRSRVFPLHLEGVDYGASYEQLSVKTECKRSARSRQRAQVRTRTTERPRRDSYVICTHMACVAADDPVRVL